MFYMRNRHHVKLTFSAFQIKKDRAKGKLIGLQANLSMNNKVKIMCTTRFLNEIVQWRQWRRNTMKTRSVNKTEGLMFLKHMLTCYHQKYSLNISPKIPIKYCNVIEMYTSFKPNSKLFSATILNHSNVLFACDWRVRVCKCICSNVKMLTSINIHLDV